MFRKPQVPTAEGAASFGNEPPTRDVFPQQLGPTSQWCQRTLSLGVQGMG